MIRRFLDVVPKPVQLAAKIILACAVPIGLIVGYYSAMADTAVRSMWIGGAIAFLTGAFVAAWLLCLGYVFADARRRAMKAALWTAVAALFPHLLGFLLYFVMRQPIASTCPECGMTVPLPQPFCSWCGTRQNVTVTSAQEGSINVRPGR